MMTRYCVSLQKKNRLTLISTLLHQVLMFPGPIVLLVVVGSG